ncbi:hypothetical protein PRIPAC_82805 [Pristionchus pacificus]|uniref:Uncharacterized protein n=1 Tax=Pristionchus pacificus TaxID=54126 RepID=A0A2A6CNL0_PRIPA|nr:hypothetical protein PRIPAC_82805 [Pristionchus pacificus]|eukprot:PDM79667.1 hypothetical protein PRIPAC_32246 [Pristionchus pacificus]
MYISLFEFVEQYQIYSYTTACTSSISNMFVAKVSVSINGTVSDRPLPLVASYVRRGRYLRYTHSCRSVPGKILSCAKIWISSQYSLAVKHRHILNEMKNQEIKTQLTHTVLNKELVILPTFDSFSGESALSNIQRPSDCGLAFAGCLFSIKPLYFWLSTMSTDLCLFASQLIYSPPSLSWIRRNPWRNWLSIAFIADLFFVVKFQEQYNLDLHSPNKPGYLGAVYWADAIIAMLIFMTLFSSCGTSGVVLVAESNKNSQAHRKLEFSANAGTTVLSASLADCHSDLNSVWAHRIGYDRNCTAAIQAPSLGGLGTIAIMSAQIFPIIDPLLVLCFVKR